MNNDALTLDDFARHYLIAAIWTGHDWDQMEGNNPSNLDEYSVSDFSEAALLRAIEDCKRFQAENAKDLETFCELVQFGPDCQNAMQRSGHEFSLTRNHHGSGFWDCDCNVDQDPDTAKEEKERFDAACERLTQACHKFREIDVYVNNSELEFE